MLASAPIAPGAAGGKAKTSVFVGPNTYGHPVPEVLEWIVATGAEVFRTDRVGEVTVAFGDRGVLVESGA